MEQDQNFGRLVAAVRAGDQDAAAELVRIYESHVRRVIRMRLTDPHLKRQFDSVDVCQSVLGEFFHRASNGQFVIDTPQQLAALLAKMAKNRFLRHVAMQQAARRDIRRLIRSSVDDLPLTARDPSPSQLAASRDLQQAIRDRMTAETLWLTERRLEGKTWVELAREMKMKTTPDNLRVRWVRALERIAEELKSAMDG